MKYLAKLILVSVCLCFSLTVNAQLGKNTFTLKGEIRNLDIDTVKIEFFTVYSVYMSPHSILSKKVINGKFQLNIDNVKDIGYIKIGLYNDGRVLQTLPQFSLPFLIEPGDNLNLKIGKSECVFTGYGAAKYNCLLKIEKIQKSIQMVSKADYEQSLDELRKFYDKLYGSAIKVLKDFRKSISTECYNVMALNYKSLGPKEVLETALLWQTVIDEGTYLWKNADYFSVTVPNAVRSDKSNTYSDYLFALETIIARLDDTTLQNRSAYFNKIFKSIAIRYKGPIRDKLLIMSMYPGVPKDSSDLYFTKAIEIVSSQEYKTILENDRKFLKGATVLNFELLDTQGRMVKLSDFKDKVVVLDFYFTGCSGCAILAKAIKPVIKEFESNPNVVFISIDVDKSKEMFLKAVESGKYSEKTSINLYTNGMGNEHDFIKYYGIYSYPALFIVDGNGKILYGNPPKPSLNPLTGEPNPNNEGVKQLIKIINDELTKENLNESN